MMPLNLMEHHPKMRGCDRRIDERKEAEIALLYLRSVLCIAGGRAKKMFDKSWFERLNGALINVGTWNETQISNASEPKERAYPSAGGFFELRLHSSGPV